MLCGGLGLVNASFEIKLLLSVSVLKKPRKLKSSSVWRRWVCWRVKMKYYGVSEAKVVLRFAEAKSRKNKGHNALGKTCLGNPRSLLKPLAVCCNAAMAGANFH